MITLFHHVHFLIPVLRNSVSVLTMLTCVLFSTSSFAQLYTRTTFNETYVPITTGGGATISTATGDNGNQAAINLGFTFNYAGTNYTTFGLNTNGLLWFDAATPSATDGSSNDRLHRTLGTNKSIAVWWNDLIDDASSDILYQLQGAPGSQKFTVQYTNYPYYTGSPTIRINCQVIFYEGTNVIEFRYGSLNVIGVPAATHGATIGIEYGAGGVNNYIDAVTGSKTIGNRLLSPLVSWPAYNFRFTLGAPSPVAGGIYNVGIGQTYPSLTQAVADLNHRGISGPVTLNLTDAQYDTTAANGSNIFPILVDRMAGLSAVNTLTISKIGDPATIAYRGSPVSQSSIASGVTFTAIQSDEEPILGVCASYTTISNINLVSHGPLPHLVEVGLMVFEAEDVSGAQHNLFDRITIDLDRTNTSSLGIYSKNTTAPGGYPGTNSYNIYRDLTIRDCDKGILLEGVGTATGPPDTGNQIITSSCSTFNSIGDPSVPNDIGNGNMEAYGIKLNAQENFVLKNNIVRNITSTHNTALAEGICIDAFFGICEVSNNIVRTVKRNNATSQNPVIGIKLTTSGNSIKELRVFNNSVSEILSTYSGVATASRKAQGIAIIGSGNVGKQKMYIWNNSVSIDGSGFPNGSNTCFEISETTNVVHVVKNNVFANFTPAQSGIANHYCFVTPSATAIGTAASASNFNDLYIANDQGTTGHVGLGNATNYSTLAAWQSGITFNAGTDANSNSANPFFANNNSDLHGTPSSVAINGTGTTPPGFAGIDIDCEPRNAPQDKGFDDFTINSITLNLGLFIQGFYSGDGLMKSVLANAGEDVHPDIADSIIVELRSQGNPNLIVESKTVLLKTNGNAIVYLPLSISGGSYFIVVKGRNIIETWSKTPVILSAITNFDFRIN